MKKTKNLRITWKYSILYSIGTMLVSSLVFLFLQVMFGDVFHDILDPSIIGIYQYGNISLILWIGLFFLLFANFITNVVIFKDFVIETEMIANLSTCLITIISLLLISWLSTILSYQEFRQSNLIEQVLRFAYFFAYFTVYIIKNPVFFWIIAQLIYCISIIFFMKFFYIKERKKQKKKQIKVFGGRKRGR